MKLFAVVGMHRSGTSIASRVLNLLGAHLGPTEDLMPPKPDNPTGFWETLSVAQLHDDLFAHLGGRWDLPPALEPGWESDPRLDAFVGRILRIVESHFSGADVAVWKDPRGSLFLPLWRRVVSIEDTVLCVRQPDEVAGSLRAREGLPSERVAALWLRYTVQAWNDGGAHHLVFFDDIYDRPRELIRQLGEATGLGRAEAPVLGEISAFIDSELRHYHPKIGDAGPAMRLARAVYELVRTARRDVVTPLFHALATFWRLEGRIAREPSQMGSVLEGIGPLIAKLSRNDV